MGPGVILGEKAILKIWDQNIAKYHQKWSHEKSEK